MILVHIIIAIIYIYLAACTLYNLVFAVAGALRKSRTYDDIEPKSRFAIFIPSYKEDNIIINTVKTALAQDYPKDKFQVIVIADQLKEETLIQLEVLPIKLIRVSFTKSTKAKSLKFALQQLPDHPYDNILILDADNLLGQGCLNKANHALNKGFKMIQLHRTAKNKNTATAILDAISEEIGNTIHRKGHRAFGMSATLIGSGMVFDYALFKSVMMHLNIDDNPAEDREINAEMLKRGLVCEYIEDAFVYDEKVSTNQVLERQRVRWISAQLSYIKKFWFITPLKTLGININYTDYALQTLILPRSILVAVNFLLACISLLLWLVGIHPYPGVVLWLILLFGIAFSLVISIGKTVSRKELKVAFLYFPSTFWSFLKALGKSSSNQKEFIHTPKEYTNEFQSNHIEE